MSALPPKGEIRQRSDLMSFRIALEGQVVQVVLGLDRLNRLSVNYRRGRLVLGPFTDRQLSSRIACKTAPADRRGQSQDQP